jgi:hypothetical protein
MGVGEFLLPWVLLIFYVIPICLFFFKRINKRIRIVFLSIPLLITALLSGYIIIDNFESESLNRRFPEVNNITFKNSTIAVRDSILVLKTIMGKLPRRNDQESVIYSLDKFPETYNVFSFNWFDFDNFENLEKDNNLLNYKISEPLTEEWKKFIGNDLLPFDTLTQNESRKFLDLIKFLDHNQLSAATLSSDNVISFVYNDSLRYSDDTGFRTNTLDTSGYFGSTFFQLIDQKDGIFLLIKK